MLCKQLSQPFLWFLHFSHCWNWRNKFLKWKNTQCTFVSGVFSLQKNWENYVISIIINCTVRLTFLCKIWISIVQGFPSRAFLKQRLAHSSVSAKTITSDSSRVYTLDWRSIKEAPWLPKRTSPQHSQKRLEMKFVSGFEFLCTKIGNHRKKSKNMTLA